MAAALKAMKDRYENQIEMMESNSKSRENTLQSEIDSLQYFKRNKQEIESSLLAAKALIEAQARKFKLSVDGLESKFLVDTRK